MRIPRQPGLYVPNLISKLIDMPPKLSQVQQDTVEMLLRQKTPHGTVAKAANCSIQQVKKMSQNLNQFGQIYAPKIKNIGRPRSITEEATQVLFISVNLFKTSV
jgi:hypothetical protein